MKQITLCRILGTIFILSGVAKAFNVNTFAYEVRLYADAYLWDGLVCWATPIAVLVCTVERHLKGLLMKRNRGLRHEKDMMMVSHHMRYFLKRV